MKIYPRQEKFEEDYGRELSKTEMITRKVALAVAFASVFVFFIKLLFL